jgi:hypothetical protein
VRARQIFYTLLLWRNEYGHTIQLKKIGIINYSFFIAIPSIFSGELDDKEYYSMPWERSADYFDNVNRPFEYLPYSDVIANLYLTILELSQPKDYCYRRSVHLP